MPFGKPVVTDGAAKSDGSMRFPELPDASSNRALGTSAVTLAVGVRGAGKRGI